MRDGAIHVSDSIDVCSCCDTEREGLEQTQWVCPGTRCDAGPAEEGTTSGAMHDERLRYPALLTFAVTASGVAFFGVGAAFWGLVAGLVALALERLARRGTA